MVEGDEHTRLRRLLAPMFSRERAQATLPAVIAAFHESTRPWPHQPAIDLYSELNELTIRSVGATLIASPPLWADGPFSQARSQLWQRMNVLATSDVSVNTAPAAEQTLQTGLDVDLIRQHVQEALTVRLTSPASDVLSMLARLVLQGQLTKRQAVDQLIALLMAAHETNAGALYWAIVLLTSHPLWAKQVTAETDRILAGPGTTADKTDGLTLVRSTIFESLRLYPPAGRQFRITARDTILGGRPVPAGTPVYVSHLALHRRPGLFASPDTFDPGRWSNAQPHTPGFIPFGAGRHRCLGRHYALHELVVLLALILHRFTITFTKPAATSASLAIALRPAAPARVVVSRRQS